MDDTDRCDRDQPDDLMFLYAVVRFFSAACAWKYVDAQDVVPYAKWPYTTVCIVLLSLMPFHNGTTLAASYDTYDNNRQTVVVHAIVAIRKKAARYHRCVRRVSCVP